MEWCALVDSNTDPYRVKVADFNNLDLCPLETNKLRDLSWARFGTDLAKFWRKSLSIGHGFGTDPWAVAGFGVRTQSTSSISPETASKLSSQDRQQLTEFAAYLKARSTVGKE